MAKASEPSASSTAPLSRSSRLVSPPNARALLSAEAVESFLVAIHFGKSDLVKRCVALAYRDLQRTVRGIANHNKGDIPRRVQNFVDDARAARTQDEFDRWHQAACHQTINAFRNIGYSRFTVGQAQKWLNMTLKYVFVLGDRVPGYEHLFGFCHVPLDQFLIAEAMPFGLPKLPGTGAWSTLNDYDIYMEQQRWFREQFDEPPLVVEFRLWLGRAVPSAKASR